VRVGTPRALWAGDAEAARRLESHPDQATLAAAQLAIARLKAEVESRTADLAEKAEAFCRSPNAGSRHVHGRDPRARVRAIVEHVFMNYTRVGVA
jgi:hypothetical protein